jgi:ribosomal protein S14
VASADSCARWRSVSEAVRRQRAAGEPLLAISRAMGLARGTVRKFAHAGSVPKQVGRAPSSSILDSYLDRPNARFTGRPITPATIAAST